MNSKLKRTMCLLLSLVLLLQAAPTARASTDVRLPEVQMSEDILANNLFYLASTSATLQEGANTRYLLRVGRGGPTDTEASVLVKISDMTAHYGTDYVVSVLDESAEVEVPEGNFAMLDLLSSTDYVQTELKDEDEAETVLAEDEEGMAAAEAGVIEALNFLAEQSGLELPEGSEELDPVQQARNLYTGVEGSTQHVAASSDTFEQLQNVADVMTTAVPGANVTLRFAPGESEKFLALAPKDNRTGDGERMFYVILSTPEGATNSAASTCAVTIADDETQTPSVVRFTQPTYTEVDGEGMLTVTVEREGALNSNVSVRLTTVDGSAEKGRDYAEVDRELFFPFGIDHQDVQIPVRTEYFTGEADFGLQLEPVSLCTVENEAKVVLTGTMGTQSRAAADADVPVLRDPGDDDAVINSLLTVKTMPGIDVSKPSRLTQSTASDFNGHNQYDSDKNAWAMDWGNSFDLYNETIGNYRMGTVGASWSLSDDYYPFWIAGARVKLETTPVHGSDDHHAYIIAGSGKMDYSADNLYYSATGESSAIEKKTDFFAYSAALAFGSTTVDFYTGTEALDESDVLYRYSNCAKYFYLANHGRCKDCNWVWVYSIEPIQRPFQVHLLNAEPLKFLQADGSYAEDTTVATAAELKDSVHGNVVLFLDESATVKQPDSAKDDRFAQLVGMDYVPSGAPENRVRMITVNDTTATSASLKLTKENLNTMFRQPGSRFVLNSNLLNWYREEKNNPGSYKFYDNDGYCFQRPTYGDVPLKPVFDYIDAKITLENPMDFPICYTISGTDYWVPAKNSYEVPGIHVGDTISISKLSAGPGYETSYTAFGVYYDFLYTGATGALDPNGRGVFVDGNPITVSGGKDGRLHYQELVIHPNFKAVDNKIVVRVKTTDVSKFEKNTGLFALTGKRNGAYTEYVIADADHTIAGRVYPICATPTSDKNVCVWTTYSGRSYVGGTLLFEASTTAAAEENIIQLTLATGASDMKLTGTLTYMDYNLRTLSSGKASSKPAAGAAVVAGDMSAIVAEDGTVDSTTMRIPASPQRYYVRCMISANGSSVLRDLRLPASGKELNITQTFTNGLSPVLSPIYRGLRVECEQADFDGLIPLKTIPRTYMNYTVHVKPVSFTSQMADGHGGYTIKTMYEKPLSVQLVTVDQSGQERRAWDVVTESTVDKVTGEYTFECQIPYVLRVMDLAQEGDPEEVWKDESVLFSAEPGDTFYLRLTTDLLSEGAGLGVSQEILDELNEARDAEQDDLVLPTTVKQFTYSDISTGLSLYAPPEYVVPVKQGLNNPLEFNFAEFDLLGSVGQNFQFPFVNIGYTPTDEGYRIYIGVSPLQIAEKIMDVNDPSRRFHADDGIGWVDMWEMKHPFRSFAFAMKESFSTVFGKYGKEYGKDGAKDIADLGAKQWKFDFTVGVYFDFDYGEVRDQANNVYRDYCFSGMGGYVSATLGFKKAWYFIIPVIMIPGYIGIEATGTVMGFFGVHREGTPPEVITFDEATHKPGINWEGQFNDNFNWSILANGMFQLSAGVGLCGTIGIRGVGEVDIIANYEPSRVEGIRDWGAYINFRAGFMIDLLLYSKPMMWDLYAMKFGKFEDYDKKSGPHSAGTRSEESGETFGFRSGETEESQWLGAGTQKRGAFTPKQTYTLVEHSYEHAEPQLITLKNGTVVLAYLSNDPAKGPYQRTTLMLTTYQGGEWSEPVAVSNDGTADFQPSIAETNDGRVLIAWASTEADDITEDTELAEYLRSVEIYAAFAEIGADGSVTVGQTQRISKDQRIKDGEIEPRHYYDANPTVVCDTNSGDAIVYYIKSGSATVDGTELANPYINDSIICYLPYDGAKGKWMTDEFYEGEIYGETPEEVAANEQYLIDNFCGQRFLDSATFEGADGDPEYYAIPDFTAISYDGMAVYAYTIDRDSSNDTDTDKEMFLQTYSFADHATHYQIRLTDDLMADALPQLFRAKNADASADESAAHTKLFWYRGGNVCYIDVSSLLQDGINADGTLKEKADGSGTTLTPIMVTSAKDSSGQAKPMADFRVAEDSQGRLYIIWTESVNDGDSIVGTQELFAMGFNTTLGEEGVSAGWSNPYRLTYSGVQNDEAVLTLVGEDLLLVHNQYEMKLTEDENEPLQISNMRLAATTLAPCGSVVTENAEITFTEPKTSEQTTAMRSPIEYAEPGDGLTVDLQIGNNGLTTADGYHVDVYAVLGETEECIWSHDSDTRLLPNSSETLSFEWTLPESFDGMYLRVVTQENHYSDRSSYETEPFRMHAYFELSDLSTYQAEDGFHLRGTLTNSGNAPTAAEDELSVRLSGPYDLADAFEEDELVLYRAQAPALAPGACCTLDIPVEINPEMMGIYSRVYALAAVSHQIPYADSEFSETWPEYLSQREHVEFRLRQPMNFTLLDGKDLTLEEGQEIALSAGMDLGELLGGEDVTFSVQDVNVARVEDGSLVGVGAGETTVYATHVPTGTTVGVTVTVTRDDSFRFDDVQNEKNFYFTPVYWAYYHSPQITDGTSPTTFSPTDGASRAQVVTFLWRAAGCPEPTSSTNPFTDVPEGVFYTQPVLWAVEEGITNGTTATAFSPAKICTRGEFVTFLYRFAGSPAVGAVENPFSDVEEGRFYCNPVLWAVEQKVTDGTSPTTFSPVKDCTRGEIVTFLYRYMGEE